MRFSSARSDGSARAEERECARAGLRARVRILRRSCATAGRVRVVSLHAKTPVREEVYEEVANHSGRVCNAHDVCDPGCVGRATFATQGRKRVWGGGALRTGLCA
eukprot:6205018-Pleurochrysis_carterae.AAC.3